MPEFEIRALLFFALIAEIFALVLVNRSFGASFLNALVWRNTALRNIAITITGVTALILLLPSAQIVLKFGSIAWSDVGLALGLGAVLFVLVEGSKPAFRRLTVDFARHRKRPSEVPP
jgi:Ca2+-transporting ATPase